MRGQRARHVARMSNNRWAKITSEWTPREEKRVRGRPKRRWRGNIDEVDSSQWMMVVQNRSAWRELWRPSASSGTNGWDDDDHHHPRRLGAYYLGHDKWIFGLVTDMFNAGARCVVIDHQLDLLTCILLLNIGSGARKDYCDAVWSHVLLNLARYVNSCSTLCRSSYVESELHNWAETHPISNPENALFLQAWWWDLSVMQLGYWARQR